MTDIDLVSVFHNDHNYKMWADLVQQVYVHESPDRVEVYGVDNRVENRGFSKGCNIGSLWGEAPVIGFVNPDAKCLGPFVDTVMSVLQPEDVVVTGHRFGKQQYELNAWGVQDWVCGACFFVERDWFMKLGGFDEVYVWGWEETDFIRRTEMNGKRVVSVDLPFYHESPNTNNAQDIAYKRKHFEVGATKFKERWGW